ncbi:MAG: uroporphyrinogen-III synthase [Candidatus Eisenbacteria bacterium]|nr:uroporphyrinogen-III synthase [Candidatus Eisenbacteria bacterium]MCC7142095.1 uroporphyrinogen-III synthase [Candidatus Eisenbacteria bacterium]
MLITREERANPTFEDRLVQAGARVHGVSLTQTAQPSDPGPLRAALLTLSAYDWVVLTSGRGVKSVALELRALGIDPRVAAGKMPPRWGCVGPGTASSFQTEFDRAPDLVPQRFDAASLAAELLTRLDESGDGARDRRVLFPAAANARAELPTRLRGAGCRLNQVVAYEITADPPPIDRLLPPEDGAGWDVVVFTSGMAVQILLQVLGTRLGESGAQAWLGRTRCAVLGLSAAEALREAGIEPSVFAARPTMNDLADAIIAYLGAGSQEPRE